MGSNGTVDERLAEAEAARAVLGAAWRVNLRWPDRGIGDEPRARPCGGRARSAPRVRAPWPFRMAPTGIRITWRRARCSTEAVFNSGLRRYDAGTAAEAWRPEWVCYYFINDAAPPSFVVDVSAHYEQKRRALRCHVSQFKVPVSDGVATRLTSPLFEQLVESRDAQFGALAGVAFAEGVVVKEPDVCGARIVVHGS